MFEDKKKRTVANTVPNWTENNRQCGVGGCENDTDIAMVVVLKNGRRLTGRFSDFGTYKRIDGDMVLTMRDGVTFIHWLTRCSQCFTKENLHNSLHAG